MIDSDRLQQIFSTRYPGRITTADSHTAGEATRLILHGCGDIPGATMAAKREFFMAELDHVRAMLTREPRGHRDILAAAVTEPVTPGADFGLIYMDAKRYPFLCGHATMGAVTTLLELGVLAAAGEAEQAIIVDTPSGPMTARAKLGARGVESVALAAVPSFVQGRDLALDVPELGTITVDTVCVGGFFVMVDGPSAGLDLRTADRGELARLGMEIIRLANEQLTVSHPERPEVCTIDVVEFCDEHQGRGSGIVVYGESHVDRCPCGTGTTAKLTLLHAKGKLQVGDSYVNAGPLGSTFTGRVLEECTVGSLPAIRAEVSGAAAITGLQQFVLDPKDPFPEGFLL